MPCNLVIQSAQYGYSSPTSNMVSDVTPAVAALLAKQYQQNPGLGTFSFTFTPSAIGQAAPPSGVTPVLTLTIYWQERGASWTFTTSWASQQTVNVTVATPPKVISAIYSSPNVTVDITNRMQTFIGLHPNANFDFTVGSSRFLQAMFGAVVVDTSMGYVDPDVNVAKSLYVKYSHMVSGQEQQYTALGVDGQVVALI